MSSFQNSGPSAPAKILLLFNGPPGSGKDTAAAIMRDLLLRINEPGYAPHLFKMSQPLKDGVKALFGITEAEYDEVERTKEEPSELLHGMSFRKAQILLSEDFVKKHWGRKSIFGEMAYRRLVPRHEDILISSDTGFNEEVPPLLPLTRTAAGSHQVILTHLKREGHDFRNDSRNYITIPGVKPILLDNPGEIDAYAERLESILLPIIRGFVEAQAMENLPSRAA